VLLDHEELGRGVVTVVGEGAAERLGGTIG
jgi:hypothetical protein